MVSLCSKYQAYCLLREQLNGIHDFHFTLHKIEVKYLLILTGF